MSSGTAPARRHELHVGPVTRTQIVRFAGAGGDFNPLHHDETFAVAAGEPSVFAMGQLTAALLARLMHEWVGGDRLRALSVRFTAKVWPGDELDLHGEVTEELVAAGEPHWHCELSARRGGGEVVARGTATVAVSNGLGGWRGLERQG